MTSPPTSSGWHIDCPGAVPQTSQVRTSSLSSPWRTGRLRRTARHERGLACASAGAIGSSSGSATADSSRSALLLRTRTRTAASGTQRFRCERSSSWPSCWSSATCMPSAKRACECAYSAWRAACASAAARRARRLHTGAVGDPDADEAEHAAQQEDRFHRDQRRGPQLLDTVAVEQPLKPAVGGEEGVERLVAGDGIGAGLAPPLGRELECVRSEVLPLLLGALLRVDLAQLGLVVGGHPAGARQCLVHLPIPGKERQQLEGAAAAVVRGAAAASHCAPAARPPSPWRSGLPGS